VNNELRFKNKPPNSFHPTLFSNSNFLDFLDNFKARDFEKAIKFLEEIKKVEGINETVNKFYTMINEVKNMKEESEDEDEKKRKFVRIYES